MGEPNSGTHCGTRGAVGSARDCSEDGNFAQTFRGLAAQRGLRMTLERADLLRPVDLGDLDACVRTVDAIVEARAWEDLLWFADQCRAACERGHQLWPAAEYALARADRRGRVVRVCGARVRRYGDWR